MAILLREISCFQSVHGWPTPDVSSLPVIVSWVIRILLQGISPGILKPGKPSSFGVAFEHERAIIVTDDNVFQTIATDIDSENGNRGIKLGNLILGPCLPYISSELALMGQS